VSKVSVLSGPERRRRWSTIEKLLKSDRFHYGIRMASAAM
jgi:hypothetical protein